MTALRVVVDTESGVMPWRQVHDQITRMISSGLLASGVRLPPIRQLARDLALASGTIARVYRELEAGGWVSTARAKGTVVAEPGGRPTAEVLLRDAAMEYATRARELGMDAHTAAGAAIEAYGRPRTDGLRANHRGHSTMLTG